MPVFALFAGGFALALLVVIYWRTAQRYEGLKDEVDRLRVVQKDMSSDVRSRLEEGEKAWEQEMRPRFERLEAVEGRLDEAEAELRAALASGEEKASERNERIEDAVRTLRNAADARLADLSARMSQIEAVDDPEETPSGDASSGDAPDAQARAGESEIDFEVIEVDEPSDDPSDVVVPALDSPLADTAQATSHDECGTPMDVAVTADAADGGGRWVVLLLALVAGIALVVTALT